MTPGSILDEIIASTAEAVTERKRIRPVESLERELVIAGQTRPPRDFTAALHGKDISVIAEIKRASPSRGIFSIRLSITELAISYASAGASAISVVTEPRYFHGNLSYITQARDTAGLPVLCKDFIIDPYQIYEARVCGADAVLLIASMLGSSRLQNLAVLTAELGMTALIEVHSIEDLEKALACPARLIGINNRDLSTFNVSLETTLRLRPLVPAGITVISESGIRTVEDVEMLRRAGINAILVGESLVTSPDPARKLAELLGKRPGTGNFNFVHTTGPKDG